MPGAAIDLTGRRVVLTGGSRGIGRATVRLLASAGAEVLFGYLSNREAADAVVRECAGLSGRVYSAAGDVSRADHVNSLFSEAMERFAGVDLAVANAGIWKRAPIDRMTEAELDETIGVNLKSAFLLCGTAARIMKSQGSGRIILVSSTAGQRGEAFYSHYAATKAGIIGLTKSLAVELAPWGIRVNAVAPGWVDTDMVAGVMTETEQRRVIEQSAPLGRIAAPEDVAGGILFLASHFADHLQGEVLNINGGSVLCG